MALKKPNQPILKDEYPYQCAWTDNGMRCQKDGHIAMGGGPRYCREHHAATQTREENARTESDAAYQAIVDERVNRIVPRLEHESMHAWSMRCRDWVLANAGKIGKYKPGRMREPGEDDDMVGGL